MADLATLVTNAAEQGLRDGLSCRWIDGCPRKGSKLPGMNPLTIQEAVHEATLIDLLTEISDRYKLQAQKLCGDYCKRPYDSVPCVHFDRHFMAMKLDDPWRADEDELVDA